MSRRCFERGNRQIDFLNAMGRGDQEAQPAVRSGAIPMQHCVDPGCHKAMMKLRGVEGGVRRQRLNRKNSTGDTQPKPPNFAPEVIY
jgi:hypothetical protein